MNFKIIFNNSHLILVIIKIKIKMNLNTSIAILKQLFTHLKNIKLIVNLI
jgi:hypothetical protein